MVSSAEKSASVASGSAEEAQKVLAEGDAFEVAVDLDDGDDRAEVAGHGLVQRQELHALRVHLDLVGIDLPVALDDLARERIVVRVDARADLYSLGAVAYFLLTGTPVFSGRGALEIIHHHLQTALLSEHADTLLDLADQLGA